MAQTSSELLEACKQSMQGAERKPMNRNEYWAMKYLMAMMSADINAGVLADRMKSIDGAWRDYKLICTLTEKLFDRLVFTVPNDQLALFRRDMKLTTCKVYNRYDGAAKEPELNDYVVIPRKSYQAMVNLLTDSTCLMCELEGKQQRRCKLKRLLDSTKPYDEPTSGDACPYNGYDARNDSTAQDMMTAVDVNNLYGGDAP